MPFGVALDYVTYQPALVTKSVSAAVNNLYQTIAVVLGVVILFLGFRTGLIVGAIVPLTILLSFIIMAIWGIDLQRMSIAAIIISLGLLVDNGIVIAEDIRSRMDMGMNKKEAAIKAAGGLGIPMLTSSLTTILAFMPLMLAEDASSEYLRSLSQVIITTLLSSWFLSMFATPALCYWFLSEEKPGESKNQPLPYQSRSYLVYRRILEALLHFRFRFIVVIIVAMVISLQSFATIPKQMMPYSDRNQFLIYIDMPSGAHINETIKVTRRLTFWLSDPEENPHIENNVAYMGYGGPRFFLTLSPPESDSNVAFLIVNTKTSEDVLPIMKKVDRFILEQLPEANGRSKRMSLGAAEIGLVEYRIIGPNVVDQYRLARSIENQMLDIEGILGVTNDWNEPVIRTRVEIDQDRARRAGVSSKSIATALNAYFEGKASQRLPRR